MTRSAARRSPAHLAVALLELAAARPRRDRPRRRLRAVLVVRVRQPDRGGCRAALPDRPGRTEDLARPAPRPAYSVLASERDAPRLPPWHGRARRVPDRGPGGGLMQTARLRRCRLHRLDVRAPARARPRRRGHGARQADLRRSQGEPPRRDRRHPLRARRDRGPGGGRRRGRRVRRDRQLRRRDARGPLDLRPRGVHRHQHAGHPRPARGGARARPSLRPGLDRRGLRLDRRGLVHRGVTARALKPLQRDQDRRRPARLELLPHLRAADR